MSLFSTNQVDIVGVCEAYLDSTILDSEIVPAGYNVY